MRELTKHELAIVAVGAVAQTVVRSAFVKLTDEDKREAAEAVRRAQVIVTNAAVESDDPDAERKRLEAQHGQVWDTAGVQRDFAIEGFMAPLVVARKRDSGEIGTLMFQHYPRFYFGWSPDADAN